MPYWFNGERRKRRIHPTVLKSRKAQYDNICLRLSKALHFSGLVLLCASMFVFTVGTISRNTPVAAVGDIISVASPPLHPEAVPASLRAAVVDGQWDKILRSCIIDTRMINQSHGAFSVFAVPPGSVILSYAGGATSSGAQNCAGEHQLMVTDTDFEILKATQTPDPYELR